MNYQSHINLALKLGIEPPEEGSDGSCYENFWALTSTGQPIGLTEYSINIAAGSNTHVVQFFDWDPSKSSQLELKHFEANPNFHEFVLKSRPGSKRITLVLQCNIA